MVLATTTKNPQSNKSVGGQASSFYNKSGSIGQKKESFQNSSVKKSAKKQLPH
jgi:hypothetical protein